MLPLPAAAAKGSSMLQYAWRTHEDMCPASYGSRLQAYQEGLGRGRRKPADDALLHRLSAACGALLQGHGTHCAGLIGAVGNNSVGVAGISWQVGLLRLGQPCREARCDVWSRCMQRQNPVGPPSPLFCTPSLGAPAMQAGCSFYPCLRAQERAAAPCAHALLVRGPEGGADPPYSGKK